MQFVVVDFSVCLRLKSRFDFSLLFKIYLNVCPAHTQWENKNTFWLRYFLSIEKKNLFLIGRNLINCISFIDEFNKKVQTFQFKIEILFLLSLN